MTRAPASTAPCIVGSDARIRASLVTTPFCTGTFRSSRISTRLPRRSTSAMRLTATISKLPSAADHSGHLEDLAGITPFVVVPRDDLDERAVERDAGVGIEDRRAAVAAEIRRNHLVFGVTEDALHRALGRSLHRGTDL